MNLPPNSTEVPTNGVNEILRRRLAYGFVSGMTAVAASFDKNLETVLFDPRPSLRAVGAVTMLVSVARGLRYAADVQIEALYVDECANAEDLAVLTEEC